MEAFGLLVHGFAVLMTWKTLALMMVGLVLGIFVGVLPGLGGPNGVAILLPWPMAALIFGLTLLMCGIAAAVSINKVTQLDPAMVFRN